MHPTAQRSLNVAERAAGANVSSVCSESDVKAVRFCWLPHTTARALYLRISPFSSLFLRSIPTSYRLLHARVLLTHSRMVAGLR
eukprot:5919592-Pleurochrysis_carterae.AAC.1